MELQPCRLRLAGLKGSREFTEECRTPAGLTRLVLDYPTTVICGDAKVELHGMRATRRVATELDANGAPGRVQWSGGGALREATCHIDAGESLRLRATYRHKGGSRLERVDGSAVAVVEPAAGLRRHPLSFATDVTEVEAAAVLALRLNVLAVSPVYWLSIIAGG